MCGLIFNLGLCTIVLIWEQKMQLGYVTLTTALTWEQKMQLGYVTLTWF